jgi:hypothetical protein
MMMQGLQALAAYAPKTGITILLLDLNAFTPKGCRLKVSTGLGSGTPPGAKKSTNLSAATLPHNAVCSGFPSMRVSGFRRRGPG